MCAEPRAKHMKRLPFDRFFDSSTIGCRGGIWLLWKSDKLELDLIGSTEQEIHATVKVISSNLVWFLSAIYASPRAAERRILWNNLCIVADSHTLPWLITGDFNDIINSHDKRGGAPMSLSRTRAFLNCLNYCNVTDLGFKGPRFTWSNNRNLSQLIQERIDMAFANPDWRLMFSDAYVSHLPRTHSDHCPLLISFFKNQVEKGNKPFRFQKMWFNHLDFFPLVHSSWIGVEGDLSNRLNNVKENLKFWNKHSFGNVFRKKKKLLARLAGVEREIDISHSQFLLDLHKTLSQEYKAILKDEEDIWAMKSRVDWLNDGERNTRFFHVSTLVRRNYNRILRIQDANGVWTDNLEIIKGIIQQHFVSLFTTSHSDTSRVYNSGPRKIVALDDSAQTSLITPISDIEIQKTVWSFKPQKAPGPDGLHPCFFQRCWGILKEKFCGDIREIFSKKEMPKGLNDTLISLIPKIPNPEKVGHFRPIGLCNFDYKVVTKLIVRRLRPFLNDMISPYQASLIPGRNGVDNVILTQEIIHSFNKKKGKAGFMAVKLDLEKGYDRLEWGFIRKVLTFFKIPTELSDLIMSCISSSRISVFVNGFAMDDFCPSRGIRQGDPLSPYLFIMCMEFLSLSILETYDNKNWQPVKISRNNPVFSHLIFADDIVLFGRADKKTATAMVNVLSLFCNESGQCINLEKSKVFFSKNTPMSQRTNIVNILGVNETYDLGRYLGYPLHTSRVKKDDYLFIVDKMRGKLAGWKSRLLSTAGRLVLTQSVLESIPAYSMQCRALPASICNEIDQICRNFLWGEEEGKKKLHLLNWKDVTKPKYAGGLGLKEARLFNKAILGKLVWSFKRDPNTLWASSLTAKYGNDLNIKNKSSSLTWRAMVWANELVENGTIKSVYSGKETSFWFEDWTCLGTIRSLVLGPLNFGEEFLTVEQFFSQNHLFSFSLPHDIFSVIIATPLQTFVSKSDTFLWKASNDGQYTVQSAYNLAKGIGQVDQFWKWVWSLKFLPKLKFFLWEVILGIVPTRSLLFHRGFIVNLSCPFCNSEEETLQHLFRDCIVTQTFWQQAGFIFQPTSPFDLWLKDNLLRKDYHQNPSIPFSLLFTHLLWEIWLERNQVVFKNVRVRENLVSRAFNKAVEFFSLTGRIKRVQSISAPVSWKPPDQGWFKVNCDGSSLGNPGKAGAGSLLRDEMGNWIAGTSRHIGRASNFLAELWALKDGLALAKSLNVKKIIVELDATAIISAVTSQYDTNTNVKYMAIIDECMWMLKQFEQVKI
ncbi:reverse transcriptase [Corchorus capsularis]|uniref:Reverse transcriptase n=1 Tax=Corchorus capsularis TaxID=210143 RepID=A0A1R3IRS5_COCAP|nr:reverse transcriptase [Corchorus capsularis]